MTLLVNGSHTVNPKDHRIVNLEEMSPGNISLNSRHSLSLFVFFFSFKAPIASIVSLNAVYQLLFGLESKDKNTLPGVCARLSALYFQYYLRIVVHTFWQTPENT